jgi:hypothetical protein
MTKEQKVDKIPMCEDSGLSTTVIRSLNDRLRKYGLGGKVVTTPGILALSAEEQSKVFGQVRAFDAFNHNNDPYGEHDFATVAVDELSVMFKIDYYDKEDQFHSPDPADPIKTSRIMTVMLSDEY